MSFGIHQNKGMQNKVPHILVDMIRVSEYILVATWRACIESGLFHWESIFKEQKTKICVKSRAEFELNRKIKPNQSDRIGFRFYIFMSFGFGSNRFALRHINIFMIFNFN